MSDARTFVESCLKILRQRKATDLFLTAGSPPTLKLNGVNLPLSQPPMTPQRTAEIAQDLLRDELRSEFKATNEANFAIQWENCGRFRVNIFVQKGCVGIVMREIRMDVPAAADIGLPNVLTQMVMLKRGLILFVGSAGSGKSTSLAAMVDHRNRLSRSHIISLEDPIEFVHQSLGCIVTQREIGADTASWDTGLKNALRQSPDMMVIGEVRDRTAMEYALNFAETGHLCMATLHANNSSQAIERVMNMFPEDRRQQVWMDLSINLRAIVGQRLVPLETVKADGNGRVAAHEVLVNTPLVADMLLRGELHVLRDIMDKSSDHGMQTFDQSLFKLYDDGLIRFEDALRFAESVNDLRLTIKMKSARFRAQGGDQGTVANLSLV